MEAFPPTGHAVHVLPAGELERKLALGRPLRVKLGVDPTSPDVHLGFAVVLDRLREWQDAGHTVVLIVGDYTARIGDPSGRSSERPVLPDEELDANAQRFADQAFRVLDREKTEVRFNGEWLAKLSFAEVVRLTRILTVSRLLERDDFAKRFAAQEPISLSELLYPPMQAYDSVAIDADVEIGGTDQLYNLLTGRDVMERYGKPPQLVVTYPLLVGLDGVEKMSKSRGNYIGIEEPPEEMFGKTMSIPDAALAQWWDLVAGGGAHPDDPLEWKLELARRVTARWHGAAGAEAGEAYFTRVVREHEAPEEMPDLAVSAGNGTVYLPALLQEAFGNSGSHWRRQIDQGGVRIAGEPVASYEVSAEDVDGAVLQAGRRHFVRVRLV
jgi:tyrosyl-tRNA synthetase